MDNDNVIDLAMPEEKDTLTAVLREGARRLLDQAIKAEVEELLSGYQDEETEIGHRRVVRNGYQPEREILTGIGKVAVKVPKVRSRQGEPVSFRSALVPPYIRKTATMEAAIPWLYLKGISTGQMQGALEALVGPQAKGVEQKTFAELAYEPKTRREEFLERMDGLIAWKRLEDRIGRHYPKVGRGRRPYALRTMLLIHCVQLFYNLTPQWKTCLTMWSRSYGSWVCVCYRMSRRYSTSDTCWSGTVSSRCC